MSQLIDLHAAKSIIIEQTTEDRIRRIAAMLEEMAADNSQGKIKAFLVTCINDKDEVVTYRSQNDVSNAVLLGALEILRSDVFEVIRQSRVEV